MNKHYEFYLQCMESGYLPNTKHNSPSGLCGAASEDQISEQILLLFEPSEKERLTLINDYQSTGWWGYEEPDTNIGAAYYAKRYGFTTLRQTIVLFMACMAGEKF